MHLEYYLTLNTQWHFWMNGNKRFFSSHYLYENYVPQEGEFKFTFLRHPVDMCYSYLRYSMKMRKIRLAWKIPGIDQRLKKLGPTGLLDYQLDHDLPLFPCGYFDFPFSTCHFIGFMERINESLNILGNHIGCHFEKAERVNTTKPSKEIDNYRIEEVKAKLSKEIAIYEAALDEFDRSLAASSDARERRAA